MNPVILGAVIGLAGAVVGAAIAAIGSHWLEVRRERRRRREDILFSLRRVIHGLFAETGSAALAAEIARRMDDERAPEISSEIYEKAIETIPAMLPDLLFYIDCAKRVTDWQLLGMLMDHLGAFCFEKKESDLAKVVIGCWLIKEMIDDKLKLKGTV